MRVSEQREAGGEGVETKSRRKESALSEQEPQLLIHTQVVCGESERLWGTMLKGLVRAWYCDTESFLKKDVG